jgi:hypothetical protein
VARARTAALLCLIAACARSKEPGAGLGKAVFEGPARGLAPSPDGAWLAFLDGCAEVTASFLPPRTARCDLRLVPSAGGAARRIASGVTTLAHGVGWAPRGGFLAVLAEYDHAAAGGTLLLVRGGSEPEKVADGVTFHGFLPGGDAVAAVAGGRLVRARPGAAPEWTPGAENVSSFDVDPASSSRAAGEVVALLRRPVQAGGALVALTAQGAGAREIARGAGDYAFSPAGGAYAFTVQAGGGYELRVASASGAPRAVAKQVRAFAFSGDGRAIAFLADAEPGRQGNLLAGAIGAPPVALAREVGEFRWAKDAARLAWLEEYDPRVRSGTLGAGAPGLAPRRFAANVSDFELSPDGALVAFLQHTTRGGYSVDLGLARVQGEEKPRVVAQGVFGFSFSPDGRWLYYRTRCVRNAEACDLERIPAAGLPEGAKPEGIAAGVKSFEFDPRDPGRILVTWQRTDMVALDLAVWERGKLVAVDTRTLPGSARFLGPDSRRVAYVVVARERPGVYVAELPR